MAMEDIPMRIDAHQHFWRYRESDFGWIDESMAAIRRDFLPEELRPILDSAGIDRTVAVQARQTIEETEWLLELAEKNTWIAGVVGWVPLADENAQEILEPFTHDMKLRGVRHVLQGEPSSYMERDDFNRGLALLSRFQLTYDLLVLEHQLDATIQLVDRHPKQAFVLDHAAKPRIALQELEPWRSRIQELALRPHVCCKLSGMITEADYRSWTEDQLRPYIETVLDAFGPSRSLFGSDWPVCTVAGTYARWIEFMRQFIRTLSQHEQAQIMGINTARSYGL